ncbi:hypothetical protein ABZ876_08245 [Streptomyces sp. NPDC046931]|uniref:hypothetical protein n=1 Tax=Streptomyces sp. NPDC046931 TaxID=3154806 RepID=UPI0033FABE30
MNDTAACIVPTCLREMRPWEQEAAMLACSPCLNTMRAQLTAIPAALIVLRDGSMQRERTGEPGRTGTREAPLPCRIDTLNLIGPAASGTVHDPHGDQTGQRPLVGVLGDWVRLICEERRLNGPDAWTPTALAGWLRGQVAWVSTQPFAGEFASELRSLMWAIRGIARVEVRTRAVSRPCPGCGYLSLARTDHDAYTRCSTCGNAYTDAELNADAVARSAA